MFCREILNPLLSNIEKYGDRNAFCINKKFYTYKQLGQAISKIREAIRSAKYQNFNVGLVYNDDLETYASIFALWLEGCGYVPLHSGWPLERCLDIVEQVGIDLILDSSKKTRYEKSNIIHTSILEYKKDMLEYKGGGQR